MNKALLFCFIAVLLFTGCKKNELTEIGLNVHPIGDRVLNLRSHISLLSAFTLKEDSVSSDERTLNLLGAYTDPVFGLTSAGFFTQLMLSSNNVSFGVVTSVDSAVLYLHCKSSYPYGTSLDLVSPQKIKVYEYTGNKGTADTLYSNYAIQNSVNPDVLADTAIKPMIDNGNMIVAIHISKSIANKILQADPSSLVSPETFLGIFKGFYVHADTVSTGNSIMYFDLMSSLSKLKLFYKDSINASKSYDLVINSSCARASLFHHSYPSFFGSFLNREDVTTDKIYIQSMSGPRALLKIPSFDSWKDSGHVIINKAELMLKVDLASVGSYAPPEKLLLVSIDENGRYTFLHDFLVSQKNFDGNYDQAANSYKFNIQLHLQDIINGKKASGNLYLFPIDNKIFANRVVILNNATERIKIDIVYSRL